MSTTSAAPPSTPAPGTVTGTLAPLLTRLLGDPLPIRIRAWDGSEAGPADAPTLTVTSRRALRRLLWSPGELGLAEAYITGDIDVEGDLGEGLRRIRQATRERAGRPSLGPAERARALTAALRLGAIGARPAPPAGRAALRGSPHSKTRDRAAISHHYDLSNEFYALLLDPSMAYSCGYFTSEHATLAEAQTAKLELICRKLGLAPGMRLLDVGCGWGSLALYAAEHYRVEVTAVTLAERQHAFVRARADAAGLSGRVTVRLCDYREIADGPYDAISSIEMGEHVGAAQYPAFARRLHRLLRPRGRLLVQQMSRGAGAPGGGAFIETYIAPDMHMRPVGATVALLEEAGLEVRQVEALREHYSRTVDAWRDTLELRWDTFTDLVGEESARVWRLYLVGASLAFSERRMGVDQLLTVRPGADGTSGFPATPHAWYPAS
ncbi:SAM-dependent methyltransferase [Kitasatospora mediocidica]|uniref:SAM-dependent methyltransferase n=1 Tax=Kitasatospora mediocidica TaxID=58352 RepID=UPI0005669546|nr:cyclopropane-fatty-acyl-phospholipid synthase family protein [Kitasatospora mediocidica]